MGDHITSPAGPARKVSTRRTRFVCIADTHNHTAKLPKGDVLIHAGDLTKLGRYSELSKTVAWLEQADFEAKIVVAGNHDITLDSGFYAEYGQNFHKQNPEDTARCLSLLKSCETITYLCHESATIRLGSPKGPRTTFTVFGSPYSPRWDSWAFQYARSTSNPGASSPAARELWSSVPLDTDILVTHTPAHTHCDEARSLGLALGCEDLRRAMWRVRPRLHVCGHVHEGRGAERVRWALGDTGAGSSVTYAEDGVERWKDPHPVPSGKMSLVDLSRHKGNAALDNDGAAGSAGGRARDGEKDAIFAAAHLHRDKSAGPSTKTTGECCTVCDGVVGAEPGIGTFGLGGDPTTTARCDRPALQGRMHRRETCVVNCAITATSFPHKGGKRFNKPIVVDLDLPVWT